ncbi:MAG: 4-hydroxy-tetrahydrodipicolinate reductase [Rickettsiaceae bacterium]
MYKKLGIVGHTGRIGSLIVEMINRKFSDRFNLDLSFYRNDNPQSLLNKIYENNDYVLDFSSSEITDKLLKAAKGNPKPTVICTTGWDIESYTSKYLNDIANYVPIVIAPNTSMGSCIQNYLSMQLAKFLDDSYDIDISEIHHRNKIDTPSGTAKDLSKSIQSIKIDHNVFEVLNKSRRQPKSICISSQRSGNVFGSHKVSFTNKDEVVSVEHQVFNREVFAKGAIKILLWLDTINPVPGIYSMINVLEIKN